MPFLPIAAAALSLAATTSAPNVTLYKALPPDSAHVEVAASVLPVQGGAIIAGWSIAPDGETDGLLIRVDDTGAVKWRRKLGGPGNYILFALAPPPERGEERGQYTAVGMAPASKMGKSEGWLLRFEDDGNVVRNSRIGGGSVRFTSVERDSNRLLVAGQNVESDSSTSALLFRPNPDQASPFFDLKFWKGGPETRGLAAVPVGPREAILVGAVGRPGDEGDGFVTRLDASGQSVWTKNITGAGRQLAYHVSRAGKDGSVLVVGYGDTAEHGVDGFARKYGPDGTERWNTALGDDIVDRAVHGITLSDGSSVVVGYSRATGGKDDDPAAWTTVVYGLDVTGARTWTQKVGGPGRESGRWIAGTRDNLWVVGQETAPGGGNRIFVARLGATLSNKKP